MARKKATKTTVAKTNSVTELKTQINDMIITLETLNKSTMFHLEQTRNQTGKITLDDIQYCLDMTTRILINKYDL